MPDKPEETEPHPGCPQCPLEHIKYYWCEMCRQTFESKRCPLCGLKLKRIK